MNRLNGWKKSWSHERDNLIVIDADGHCEKLK